MRASLDPRDLRRFYSADLRRVKLLDKVGRCDARATAFSRRQAATILYLRRAYAPVSGIFGISLLPRRLSSRRGSSSVLSHEKNHGSKIKDQRYAESCKRARIGAIPRRSVARRPCRMRASFSRLLSLSTSRCRPSRPPFVIPCNKRVHPR